MQYFIEIIFMIFQMHCSIVIFPPMMLCRYVGIFASSLKLFPFERVNGEINVRCGREEINLSQFGKVINEIN